MYGHGKSDSAIVAKKSVNKAGSPAAERMEPKAETEGNATRHVCRRQPVSMLILSIDAPQSGAIAKDQIQSYIGTI